MTRINKAPEPLIIVAAGVVGLLVARHEGGMRVCLLLALSVASCGPDHGVAGAYDDDDDCPTGECYTGSDPRYCTAACEDEGSTAQCPEDNVCKRIEGGDASCLLLCEDDGDCSRNSESNEVPDADGLRGCEPVL